MNTDKIIHEWFYRLPKGYAIAPYTKQELDILDEVLAENGLSLNEDVDILDQAFNDAKPVKDEEKQHTLEVIEESLLLQEGYTKDDLIAVIKETPLPDKLISYISRLIDSANSKTSALDGLKKRNFDDKTAKGMFDKAVEMDSYKQLQDLVAGEVSGIDFDSLGDSGNLQPFIDKMGFSKEYADWLYNYIPAGGGVNVGAGENILRVILKGGHVPSSGDVGAEGIKIELKSTQSSTSAFRMRGQSGYGSGYDIALDIFEAIQTAYGDNLPDNFPDVTSSTAIQLYYKSGKESLADQYLKDLVKKNLLKRSQIVDIYSKDGSFNIKELFPRLSALEFRYYADSEPWDEFMSLNYKKDYLIMGKDDSIDELTKIFKDRFNIGAPNTKPKATSQDSMTATQLKST